MVIGLALQACTHMRHARVHFAGTPRELTTRIRPMNEYYYDEDELDDDLFSFAPPQECDSPYTITQINNGVADILEGGNTLIWFVGEISNFKRHSSGHCYLRLKDRDSQVPAVIWRSTAQRIKLDLEDGMEVTGLASLRVYRKGGYYQLDIRRVQPAGLGELYAAFEALKKRLESEGLFDDAHKKPLPRSVSRLGVITAKTGAALRDVMRVVVQRSPRTDIVLHNVRVQGETAAAEIAAAVKRFNACDDIDLLIVGRGGGSIEDLWAFNEETVARAIFESDIPVISAVGHETDFTIADFVADARAPTPSAAAEMAVPDEEESRRYFVALAKRCVAGYIERIRGMRGRLTVASRAPALRDPVRRLVEARQTIDDERGRASRAMGALLRDCVGNLGAAAGRLQALSPLAVLGRGFSVVTTEDGSAVRNSAQLHDGDTVTMRFSSGSARGRIEHTDTEH